MSRANHEEEIIITGKIRPRMIKSKVNSFFGRKILEDKLPGGKSLGKRWGQTGISCLHKFGRIKCQKNSF